MHTVCKAVPYGAMAGASAAGSFLTASAGGAHALASQERACGMLVNLHSVARGSCARAVTAPCAVVKAQTADFQSNDVAPDGLAAVLSSQPRGRWRKIARAKVVPIEDSRTPFSDPDKAFQPRVQHHGEYVRRLGKLPKESPALRFVLYNDGYAVADIRHRLAYEIGVPSDAVHLPSHLVPGGFFGCSTHFGVCLGVTREQLVHASRHYSLHPLIFDPREYASAAAFTDATSAAPRARVYRLVLRHTSGTEAEIRAALQKLARGGFANYYGLERFGCGGSTLFDMAHFAARGDYPRATGCYLQMLADTDPLHHTRYGAYLNCADGMASGVLAQWALQCRAARVRPEITRVIETLAAFHQPASAQSRVTAQDVWCTVPVRGDADRAAAELIWNTVAAQRLLLANAESTRNGSVTDDLPALVGDVIERPDGSVYVVKSDAEASELTLADVVLPVPADGCLTSADTLFPEIGAFNKHLYESVASQYGLAAVLGVTPTSAPPRRYRHVLGKPKHLQAAVTHDPNSFFALKTDLFLLQEHKPPGSLDLNFAHRAREPSVYNVSERFAERMGALKAVSPDGAHSVAISLVLPGDTSPFVALREVFDLRYATVQDLYPVR